MYKTLKTIITILMLLFGLFLTVNIYVIGNPQAAIEMHDDLPKNASNFYAISKVIKCFVVGILFTISALGIFFKRLKWSINGIFASLIFIVYYLVQLIGWSSEHPRMWIDFGIFGTGAAFLGLYSYYIYKQQDRIKHV